MQVPGSLHPLLLAQAGDPLDEFGKIERSVRFRPAANPYLTRTPAVSGDRTKWTVSLWFKITGPGALAWQYLFGSGASAGATTELMIRSDGAMQFTLNSSYSFITTRIFRDYSQHMHLVVNWDTTNAVAEDRARIYINGERVSSFSSTVGIGLGMLSFWNTAGVAMDFGAYGYGHGFPLNGQESFICFVDGQALLPTAFGLSHPKTGQWRPRSLAEHKARADSGGANSGFWPFLDGSTAAALGKDWSIHSNNLTPANISVTDGPNCDWLVDTPTNNFATLNPLKLDAGTGLYATPYMTYSDGALRCSIPATDTTGAQACSTLKMVDDKFQAEFVLITANGNGKSVGITSNDGPFNSGVSTYSSGRFAYHSTGVLVKEGVAVVSGLAPFGVGDVIGVCYDSTTATVAFFKGGILQGSITGIPPATYAFCVSGSGVYGGTGDVFVANFGQRPFSFPVTGFKSLCTKNLPFPRIPNPKAAFADVTDSGANIVAALAAASPWPSWIRIYKRRDAAEGWRWQFSDDPLNCLDTSQAVGKFAFPALSGASYSGQAFNASASNGIAMGRLSHASGVADVVADGLANARKMVILKGEVSGAWYVYHPDLTAGKLLYLNSMAAETTDATITAVTAGGFTVAAALATDVYRWIAFAETTGFLKLGAYTGNASSDGPFGNLGGSPLFFLQKNAGNAETSWRLFDSVRSPRNPAQALLFPTYNYAEDSLTSNATDLVSNGFKLRTTDTALNQAVKNVFMSVVAPFRYANAR